MQYCVTCSSFVFHIQIVDCITHGALKCIMYTKHSDFKSQKKNQFVNTHRAVFISHKKHSDCELHIALWLCIVHNLKAVF